MLRRRRANAKYAGALSLLSSPTSSKCEVEESARLLQEACLLYKAAIHMARVTQLPPHHVPAPTNVTCLVSSLRSFARKHTEICALLGLRLPLIAYLRTFNVWQIGVQYHWKAHKCMRACIY